MAEEHLRTSFEKPEPEFVDGELVERHLGEMAHSRAHVHLIGAFAQLTKRHALHVLPGITLRVSPTHYRIADLAVFAGEEPQEDVPSAPPLVVIEIVSRDDRHTEILRKLEEYRTWGVQHVWLVDPWLKKIYVYSTTGLTEVQTFAIAEYEIEIPVSEIL